MTDLLWLSDDHLIASNLTFRDLTAPRVDDRLVVSGIVLVIRRDFGGVTREYGPPQDAI